MIVNIPLQKVVVIGQFIGVKELVPAMWHSVTSFRGKPIGCNVLMEDGASYFNLPLRAIAYENNVCRGIVFGEELQHWVCPNEKITATTIHCYEGLVVDVKLDEMWVTGVYVATLDWGIESFDTTSAALLSEHKCAHLIRLDGGQYVLLPNNLLRFNDRSFTPKPYDLANPPKYKNQPDWDGVSG